MGINPLVNGLFEAFKEHQELNNIRDDDAFEMFCAGLALPEGVLDQAELSNFLLDPGSPGIDIAVLELNGKIVRDPDEVREVAEEHSKLEVGITLLQVKRSDTVSTAQILSFGSTARKLVQGGGFPDYPQLDTISSAIKEVYRFSTKFRSSPSLTLYFITSASPVAIHDPTVEEKAREVQEDLVGLGFLGSVECRIWGAQDITSAHQKRSNANEVEITLEKQTNLPQMPGVDQAILGVISVAELFKMVVDEDEQLDERVFYENVRGFQGIENSVNQRMMDTMASDDRALLMVLNNGITVVAESYSPKPGDALSLTGYQVVNGCQTTNCLFHSREALAGALESTYVPVKVVVTSDDEIAAQIIRATNSQTAVTESDLVALSRFQKELEDFYRVDECGTGLTYERRSGQFYGKDVVKTRVVNVNDQLRSMAAVGLNLPHFAARYPSRLYGEVEGQVFNSGDRLLPYVASAYASYRLENAFRTGLESMYKPARYHILMAFTHQALRRRFSPLNAQSADRDARTIISLLKESDPVTTFRRAAQTVAAAGGGEVPSRDRLKRQQFTQELQRQLS